MFEAADLAEELAAQSENQRQLNETRTQTASHSRFHTGLSPLPPQPLHDRRAEAESDAAREDVIFQIFKHLTPNFDCLYGSEVKGLNVEAYAASVLEEGSDELELVENDGRRKKRIVSVVEDIDRLSPKLKTGGSEAKKKKVDRGGKATNPQHTAAPPSSYPPSSAQPIVDVASSDISDGEPFWGDLISDTSSDDDHSVRQIDRRKSSSSFDGAERRTYHTEARQAPTKGGGIFGRQRHAIPPKKVKSQTRTDRAKLAVSKGKDIVHDKSTQSSALRSILWGLNVEWTETLFFPMDCETQTVAVKPSYAASSEMERATLDTPFGTYKIANLADSPSLHAKHCYTLSTAPVAPPLQKFLSWGHLLRRMYALRALSVVHNAVRPEAPDIACAQTHTQRRIQTQVGAVSSYSATATRKVDERVTRVDECLRHYHCVICIRNFRVLPPAPKSESSASPAATASAESPSPSLDTDMETDKIAVPECGHVICLNCAENWIFAKSSDHKCPTCRRKLRHEYRTLILVP